MNQTEALQVLRKVIGYQPSQKLDDLTAEAWAEALEPHDVRDGLDAVAKIGRSPRRHGQPFWMEPRDIVEAIVQVESERLFRNRGDAHRIPEQAIDERHEPGSPEWRKEMKALTNAMKSRDWVRPERKELTERPVESIVRQLGQIRNGGHPSGIDTLCERERMIAERTWDEGRAVVDGAVNPYRKQP